MTRCGVTILHAKRTKDVHCVDVDEAGGLTHCSRTDQSMSACEIEEFRPRGNYSSELDQPVVIAHVLGSQGIFECSCLQSSERVS